jgi:large subunit ribosomal protein L10
MNKKEKQAKVSHYEEVLNPAGYAILAEFDKIPVTKVELFRRELAEVGCNTLVLKNTLARIVFERKGMEEVCEYLVGTSVLFYGTEEIAPAAKLLQKLFRRFEKLNVKAIVFDKSVYPKEQFASFTSLPTKDEARARLLSVFKAPQSGFVTVINSTRRLVTVLGAYAQKQGG